MDITKTHISRRTALKGVGVTMALPFLEAMVPARATAAQIEEERSRRYTPGGKNLGAETGRTDPWPLRRCWGGCIRGRHWCGRAAGNRAMTGMWTRRCEFYLANPIMLSVRHCHPPLAALEAAQAPQVAEYNRAGAERFMKTLDRRLADHEFLAEDRFTIADIVAVVGLDFARLIKYRPPEELANFARWLEAFRARPGARRGA